MANEEHLKRLRQGAEAWNVWRKEHPEIRPDLAGANLDRTRLQDANLQDANLQDANLAHANLARANLARANLRGVIPSGHG